MVFQNVTLSSLFCAIVDIRWGFRFPTPVGPEYEMRKSARFSFLSFLSFSRIVSISMQSCLACRELVTKKMPVATATFSTFAAFRAFVAAVFAAFRKCRNLCQFSDSVMPSNTRQNR
jgi:hypothetical protein